MHKGRKFRSKHEVREFVWRLLREKGISNSYGKIPNFFNSFKACEKLKTLEEFKNAKVVFSAPDGVLRRAREIVLESGKELVVATPHMKDFRIISNVQKNIIKRACTIKGLFKYGRKFNFDREINIFLTGCVAVDLKGNRVGKGSGYGDREFALLKERGLIKNCTVVAVCHDLQIFDDLSHLCEEHDVKSDYILTPTRIIKISL